MNLKHEHPLDAPDFAKQSGVVTGSTVRCKNPSHHNKPSNSSTISPAALIKCINSPSFNSLYFGIDSVTFAPSFLKTT
jgi:hypothetical protein